ncbi:TetR family transcriptional regulator [Pseudonocardia sulfidoxydans NBRC 16205]|uniref:TetR family transcriptional regulator n=1 Tax=Pseudonocardia sulfidoxydans NBRC 16205 TaxID=1223511 RepID=A0A511DHK0_9PSEU|nr:TetR family transcriptional regulator [Pseudonocardia sulfidoxydans]GEL23244.1 TetR family transcriptional regulator [Pseudonocardia sulfidoxydans NBRC 16205]
MADAIPGPAARRRGRRRAGEDTREPLLAAARAEFAARGFEGATVRRIAERAGVDAAMVNHWFGGKEQLFVAALDFPVDISTILDRVLPGDRDELGARIVRTFLTVWDTTGGAPLGTLIRSVASHESAARLMREFVATALAQRIVRPVAPDRHEMRAALCGTQIIGLGMIRYVLRLEPIASATHDEVVTAVAPTLQRYLTGPLD